MKRVGVAALLGLLLPALTLAQPNQPNRGGGEGHQGARPAAPAHRPAMPTNRSGAGRPEGAVRPGRPQITQQRPFGRPPGTRPPQAGGPPRPVAQSRPPTGNQFWHRGSYHPRVRGPAYRYPPGWGPRRWAVGARLPALFLAPAFIYGGWAAIGLQPPPPGYAWVRYGPDLLEVNVSTGQVVDVVYGVFY